MRKSRNSGEKDDEGQALWQHVTQSVKPYRKTKASEATPRADKVTKPPKAENVRLPKPAVEARLDLHGMTQADAFDALSRFIPGAARSGKRKILVITGKGPGAGGVLKQNLPLWLENPVFKKYVESLAPADQKDGGGGAFYVRLKK